MFLCPPSVFVFVHPSSLLHPSLGCFGPRALPVSLFFLLRSSKSRSKQSRPVYDHCRPHMDTWRLTHNFTFMISSCLSRSKALGKEVLSHAARLVVKLFSVILLQQVFLCNNQQRVFSSLNMNGGYTCSLLGSLVENYTLWLTFFKGNEFHMVP